MIDQLIKADTLYMSFIAQMYSVNNSLSASKSAFIEVTKYAEAYAVPIESLIKGYAKLNASMDFDHVRYAFKDLFEATSMIGQVLHLAPQNMERVFNAVIQIMSKGKVGAEELKEQLGEHLPGAVAMFAQSMDMSMSDLFAKMQKGEITAKMFADNFPKYILARFSGASELAAKSIQSGVNQMQNAWTKLMITMTESGASSGISFLFKVIADRIGAADSAMSAFGKQIEAAAVQLALWVNNISTEDILKFTDGILALAKGVGTLILGLAALASHVQANSELYTNLFFVILGAKAVSMVTTLGSNLVTLGRGLLTVAGGASGLAGGMTMARTAVLAFAGPIGVVVGVILTIVSALYQARDATIEFAGSQASIGSITAVAWEEVKWNISKAMTQGALYMEAFKDRSKTVWQDVTGSSNSFLRDLVLGFKQFYNFVAALFVSIGSAFGIVIGSLPGVFMQTLKGLLSLGVAFMEDLWSGFTGGSSDALGKAFEQVHVEASRKTSEIASGVGDAIKNAMATDYAGAVGDVITSTLGVAASNIDASFEQLTSKIAGKTDLLMARAQQLDLEKNSKTVRSGPTYETVTKSQIENAAKLRKELEEARNAQEAFYKQLADADGAKNKSAAELKEMAAAAKKAAQEHDRLADAINKIEDAIDPFNRKARDMFDALDQIDKQLASNDISAAKWQELHDGIIQTMGGAQEAIVSTTKKLKEQEPEVDQYAELWKNALKRIDDAFLDLWKSAFTSFADFKSSLVNAFKEMLAQMAHQAITKPIVVAISGAIMGTGGSMAQAAGQLGGGGGSNMLSSLMGNPTSLLGGGLGYAMNYGASWLGGAGSQQAAMLASQTGAFGMQGANLTYGSLTNSSGLASGMTSMLGTGIGGLLGGMLGGKYGAIGAGLGTLAGGIGGTALAGAVSAGLAGGSMLGGASAALAAIGPVGWAALAAGAVAAFVGGRKQDHSSGGTYDFATGTGTASGGDRPNENTDKARDSISQVLQSVNAGIVNAGGEAMSKINFDISEKYGLRGNFAADGQKYEDFSYGNAGDGLKDLISKIIASAKGLEDGVADFALGFSSAEQSLVALNVAGTFAKFSGDITATTDQMRALVDGSSEYVRQGEDATATTGRLVSSLVGVNAALDKMGLKQFDKTLSGADQASQLSDQFGGLETFDSAVGDYYSKFYSASEQSAAALKSLTAQFDTLNIALPASRDAFRALVEAQDLSTESGRTMFASLIALAPAFDQIASSAGSAVSSLNITADGIKGMFKNVLDNATSAEEARQMASEQAGQMLMNSLMDTVLNQVSSLIMDSIISPMSSQIMGMMTESTAGAIATIQNGSIDMSRIALESSLQAGDATLRGAVAASSQLAAGGAYSAATMSAGGAASASAVAAGGMAGGSAVASGGAAAGGYLAGIVQQAVSMINTMSAIISSPDYQAAMGDFQKAMGSIGAAMYSGSVGGGGGGAAPAAESKASDTSSADDAQKKLIDSIKSIFDLLQSSLDKIYGSLKTASMSGMDFIDKSLSVAQLSGQLPDQRELSNAIDAVNKGLDSSNFASMVDMNRAQLNFATKLKALQDIAKRQLDGLDPMVALADPAVTGGSGTTPTAPATPAVTQSGDVAATLTAIRGELIELRTEQRAANLSIVKNTGKTSDIASRWDFDGMPEVRA